MCGSPIVTESVAEGEAGADRAAERDAFGEPDAARLEAEALAEGGAGVTAGMGLCVGVATEPEQLTSNAAVIAPPSSMEIVTLWQRFIGYPGHVARPADRSVAAEGPPSMGCIEPVCQTARSELLSILAGRPSGWSAHAPSAGSDGRGWYSTSSPSTSSNTRPSMGSSAVRARSAT